MYPKTPDNWQNSLPLVLEACSVPSFEETLLDNVSKQLSSITSADEFLQLCNEYFLCSVYYACIKLFHNENQKEMGLDDVENMFFKVFNAYLNQEKSIFLEIDPQKFAEYLGIIEHQMNEALDSDDPNICNIASSIKSIIPIVQYYHEYQLALHEITKKFGKLENFDDYIPIIQKYINEQELDLSETVEFYRNCVNSRLFLKNQTELETIFSSIFDQILDEENIGSQTNLEEYSPEQLQDIKTIISFKQAMSNNDKHGYYVHLGQFIKYALGLLTKEQPNPYYLNLFIENMTKDDEFGAQTPIVLSLKKMKIMAEVLDKLSQLSHFTMFLPYLYNKHSSCDKISQMIRISPNVIQKSIKELSLFDIVKIYYLFPSIEFSKTFQQQKFNFNTIDISQLNQEDLMLFLNFLSNKNLLPSYQKTHELFLYIHQVFCLVNEHLPQLEQLKAELVQTRSSLDRGLKKIIFFSRLQSTIDDLQKLEDKDLRLVFSEISKALSKKSISIHERLEQVNNIAKDTFERVESSSSAYHFVQHISQAIDDLSKPNPTRLSSITSIFQRDNKNTSNALQAICNETNGPKTNSNDV